MNYQGQVTDAAGANLATGTCMSGTGSDAATGGTLIWGPQSFDGTSGTGKGARSPWWADSSMSSSARGTGVPQLHRCLQRRDPLPGNHRGIQPRHRPPPANPTAPFALKANQVVDNAIIGASLADNAVTSAKMATARRSPTLTLQA